MRGEGITNRESLLGWIFFFVVSTVIFLGVRNLLGFRSLIPIIGVLPFVIIIIFSSKNDRIIGEYNSWEMGIVAAMGGVAASAAIMEINSQLEGTWPSIFWTDLVLICMISICILLRIIDHSCSPHLVNLSFLFAVITDIALKSIDPYQGFSTLGYFRMFLWFGILVFILFEKKYDNLDLLAGMLIGSLLGLVTYVGMVTGRMRFAGESFSIPAEILAIFFAYLVVVWPWQILKIYERLSDIEKNGFST